MFGPGYPGTGAVEPVNHGEGWETGGAGMWAPERTKADGRQEPPPSTLAPKRLCAVLCCAVLCSGP